jgi:hypothetical protein
MTGRTSASRSAQPNRGLVYGHNGNCRALWGIETRVTPSVFRPDAVASFRNPAPRGRPGEGPMDSPFRVEYLDAERLLQVLVRKAA